MDVTALEYTPYFSLGILVLGLGFYLIRKVVIRPRQRCPIIPTKPVSGDVIENTVCIMFSDGSSRFGDGKETINTGRDDL